MLKKCNSKILYKNENGLTDEQVDEVLNTMSYHGRRAASMNPNAMLRTPFEEIAKEFGYNDPMEYLRSPFNPKTTQYLRVTGNAPSADGAACVIVCPTEMAHKFRQKPIEVLGIGASALELMRPHNEKEITKEAARQVLSMTLYSPHSYVRLKKSVIFQKAKAGNGYLKAVQPLTVTDRLTHMVDVPLMDMLMVPQVWQMCMRRYYSFVVRLAIFR